MDREFVTMTAKEKKKVNNYIQLLEKGQPDEHSNSNKSERLRGLFTGYYHLCNIKKIDIHFCFLISPLSWIS